MGRNVIVDGIQYHTPRHHLRESSAEAVIGDQVVERRLRLPPALIHRSDDRSVTVGVRYVVVADCSGDRRWAG
jgi:hypothetical protein